MLFGNTGNNRQQSLAASIANNAAKREQGRTAHSPYEFTIDDKIRSGQLKLAPKMPMVMPPVAGVGMIAGEGAAALSPLLSRIATPIMQRALDVAKAEGTQVGAGIFEDAANAGTKYSQSSITRAGEHGQQALFDFIDRLDKMGVKPATANRLLKGFSEYADDPAQAMMTLGENMARRPESGMSAKEALVMRMLDSIGSAVDKNWLG
jgi:hypothetical protein